MSPPSEKSVTDQLPVLLRFARALTRDEHDAEDLVHDALTAAYARRAQFRQGMPLLPWLFGIVRHRFIDGWRAARRRDQAIVDLAQLSPTEAPPSQEAAFRLAEIGRLLEAMPAEQREALHLVVVEGLSYQEAASVLDVPIGTLMSRISRARLHLRAAEQGTGNKIGAEPIARPRLRMIKE
ncbi:sigma-70 family RNA polymerase sigma factor [Sphingomonas sp. AP4-R1]|uniref:sigma-70 family RNA polymerase sigma factor n=1 Tax=Sphingomonas sp. AP4-R1 TaxID=2735134 RepID=UPI001493342C|nr:sigma-70 family RNA polymerase sigma factor [Sphingomonas sp. AP4-R1]QJU56460.1 sigma-70 family RNA polymerase sigma factor [Sphingomonas sp. AP4-R1]